MQVVCFFVLDSIRGTISLVNLDNSVEKIIWTQNVLLGEVLKEDKLSGVNSYYDKSDLSDIKARWPGYYIRREVMNHGKRLCQESKSMFG